MTTGKDLLKEIKVEIVPREEIIAKTNEFLISEFEVEESSIEPDGNLKEILGLDSLDYIDLVVVIESNFGVKIDGKDFMNIITFNDFYDYLDTRLNKKA